MTGDTVAHSDPKPLPQPAPLNLQRNTSHWRDNRGTGHHTKQDQVLTFDGDLGGPQRLQAVEKGLRVPRQAGRCGDVLARGRLPCGSPGWMGFSKKLQRQADRHAPCRSLGQMDRRGGILGQVPAVPLPWELLGLSLLLTEVS